MEFDIPMPHVRNRWSTFLGGQWWVSWQAYTSFFRDELNLELDGDLWDRDRAYEKAQSNNGWWWPHESFVVCSDRPRALHVELIGEHSYQLHCPNGPAIRWEDGYELYVWHGTLVPEDLIMGRWSTEDILRETNTETRRCAIEHMGWPEFVVKAGLKPVGRSAPDPANPGQELQLYDVPEQIYNTAIRVLMCTNATRERDGSRHQFGLTVPATIKDPVEAAAWTFGESKQEYAKLKYAC